MRTAAHILGLVLWVFAVGGQSAQAAVFDVTDFGADPAFAGIDRDAAQAAVDAACAAGGGEVHFPAGFYRIGREHGVGGAFYSGLRLSCDNLVISGVGDASVLMPLNSGGQTVIIVCETILGTYSDWDCDSTHPVQNITIRDLKIWDDDPEAHCVIIGNLFCGSEESHGITVRNGHDIVLERLTLDNLGDESITFGAGSSNGVIQDSSFTNCPSLHSGGSCIELDWGSDYQILRNDFDGGRPTGAIIYVNNNTANEVSNVLIQDNQLIDSSPGSNERVGSGIWIGPNNADIRDIRIIDNSISMDFYSRTSIRITAFSFGVADLVVQGNHLEGQVNVRSAKLSGLVFDDNTLISTYGRIAEPALTFSGTDVEITNNVISGLRTSCIELGGFNGNSSDVSIRNNLCLTNRDSIPDSIIFERDLACDPQSSVSSGLEIKDNLLWPSGGEVIDGIQLSSCSTAVVENNQLVLTGSSATNGIQGGGSILGNQIFGATTSIRALQSTIDVGQNSLDGTTCVELDGTSGGFVFGNDLTSCTDPIVESNGAGLNACWNNLGLPDGCSLLLACHDGIDNDDDGFVDDLDPQCSTTAPFMEDSPTNHCGLGFELAPALVALGIARRRRRREFRP